MQKKDLLSALQQMRQKSKQRKFVQSIELIINFKGLDTKKPVNQIDVKVNLPFSTGKKGGGKSLLFAREKTFIEAMKGTIDRIIEESSIPSLGKKEIASIIADFDIILAEGPVMIPVGKYLGQHLAPKGKMPKPVQPDPAIVDQMIRQMGSVTRVTNRKGKFMPVVQGVVGNEKMTDEQLSENAQSIIDAVIKALPRKLENLKSVYFKESMGPAIKVGAQEEGAEQK